MAPHVIMCYIWPGFSPVQLEWDMKLWWVHLEAMVATLMVFNNTRQEEDWERFRKVFKYSFDHVSIISIDRNNSHKAKLLNVIPFRLGWSFKCCFYLPRALMICENILKFLKN